MVEECSGVGGRVFGGWGVGVLGSVERWSAENGEEEWIETNSERERERERERESGREGGRA